MLHLHPWLIGQPFRIGALDAALGHIVRRQGVWAATGAEIIDWYGAIARPHHRARPSDPPRAWRSIVSWSAARRGTWRRKSRQPDGGGGQGPCRRFGTLLTGDSDAATPAYVATFSPLLTTATPLMSVTGTMPVVVLLAPIYHPLLLAEQIGTLAAFAEPRGRPQQFRALGMDEQSRVGRPKR